VKLVVAPFDAPGCVGRVGSRPSDPATAIGAPRADPNRGFRVDRSISDVKRYSIRWRAAYRYRLERLFFNEKSIIARSASVAATGCVPDSASAAGVRTS